jgi:hypothetical protein
MRGAAVQVAAAEATARKCRRLIVGFILGALGIGGTLAVEGLAEGFIVIGGRAFCGAQFSLGLG